MKAIERFNLSTGGIGMYRPGKWGLIKVSLRNPEDRAVELLATTHFEGDTTLQYGRRFWMPAKSRMVTWHPIKMPALTKANQDFFDLRSMVFSGVDGKETMAINEVGSTQFDQGFRVAADEPVTAMIMDMAGSTALASGTWADPREIVQTARFDRGLKHNFVLLSDPLIPAGEELFDSLDHLVVASDRIVTDAAGISAIRRWVASGGKLWIMADMISPALLAALLGDEDTVVEVDRVDLTSVHLDAGSRAPGTMIFDRELERPARFVRLIAEDQPIDYVANGWPAAFRRSYGSGQILVTMLGSEAWMQPRTRSDPAPPAGRSFQTAFVPSAALSQLALEFFTPRPEPLIPIDLAEAPVRQLIGYSIPSRTLVLGTLLGFTGLMLVIAVWCSRRGHLEWMGLIIPGLAVACSAVLMGAGWAGRSTIPASVAIVQSVQAIPGTGDIRTSGLAGVFSKDSEVRTLAGTQGGWMSPEMAGLEGTTRRMVWTDIDQWSWEMFSTTPGLRMVSFQTAGQVDQKVEAVAEFDSQGVHGKMTLPPNLGPGDGLIVTEVGRLSVQIQPDGRFTATADDVLGADQYLSAHVLSDEQQRRSQILSRVLAPGAADAQAADPALLVWTKPWPAGTSLDHGMQTVGSALVSIPLRWERPSAGSKVVVPAPFLQFREVQGPDGLRPTGIYDRRRRRWSERTGSATSWLGFSVPESLLPLDVKSATLTFKVLGPLKRLELSTMFDQRLASLHVWDAPVGTLTYEIKDPRGLQLDSRGRLLVRIEVGQPVNEPAIVPGTKPSIQTGVQDPASYWQIEEVTLQISAEIPQAPQQ